MGVNDKFGESSKRNLTEIGVGNKKAEQQIFWTLEINGFHMFV